MRNQNEESINVPNVESIAGRSETPRIRIERLTEFSPEARDLLQEYYLAVNVVQRDEPGTLQRMITDAGSGMWLAFSGTEAVGCVVLRRLDLIPNSSECKRLYVKPSARGHHVATSLLDAQETYAIKQGLKWIYLDTYDELNVAIALYRDRGYEQCSRYNDNPQATLFMRKRIL
jgi:ribosomal protein S18 acetylase RimI-like enzyme